MISQTIKIIDGVTCNATATVYSLVPEYDLTQPTNSWLWLPTAESVSVNVSLASVTGTGNVTVYADLCPHNTSLAYNDSTASNYQSINLGTVTADATLAIKTAENSSTGLQEPNYPFQRLRIRVVGTASNPSDTVVTAYLIVASEA